MVCADVAVDEDLVAMVGLDGLDGLGGVDAARVAVVGLSVCSDSGEERPAGLHWRVSSREDGRTELWQGVWLGERESRFAVLGTLRNVSSTTTAKPVTGCYALPRNLDLRE